MLHALCSEWGDINFVALLPLLPMSELLFIPYIVCYIAYVTYYRDNTGTWACLNHHSTRGSYSTCLDWSRRYTRHSHSTTKRLICLIYCIQIGARCRRYRISIAWHVCKYVRTHQLQWETTLSNEISMTNLRYLFRYFLIALRSSSDLWIGG